MNIDQLIANDRMAYPLYEVIAEHKLPALFHSGHSGILKDNAVRLLGLGNG